MDNISQILIDSVGVNMDKLDLERLLAIFSFAMFTCLCLVRKIEKFAVTHIFADIMILLTIVTIVVYGSIELSQNGNKIGKDPGVYAVNPLTW